MRRTWIVAVLGLMVSAGPMAAASDLPERPGMYDQMGLETYRRALYRAYLECSSSAMERFLSHAEVVACGDVYMELKLSFLAGVTMERYRAMSPKTKQVALEKGYAAYLAWRHRHLAMIRN